jgi:hypothetical protein
MVHYITSDDKYRRSPYGEEGDLHLRRYRFGQGRAINGRAGSALLRANSFLKNLIQSIARAKLRRVQHEVELRGIPMAGPDEEWIPKSPRSGDAAK